MSRTGPPPARLHSCPGRGCCFSPSACCQKRACRGPCATAAVTAAPDPDPVPTCFARGFALRAPQTAWLLGAGASANAGVPTAGQLIDKLLAVLYCSENGIHHADLARDPRWQQHVRRTTTAGRAAASGGQRVLLRDLREGLPGPGRPGPVRPRSADRPASAPWPAHARRPGRHRAGAGADHDELRHLAGGCHPPGAGSGRGQRG